MVNIKVSELLSVNDKLHALRRSKNLENKARSHQAKAKIFFDICRSFFLIFFTCRLIFFAFA